MVILIIRDWNPEWKAEAIWLFLTISVTNLKVEHASKSLPLSFVEHLTWIFALSSSSRSVTMIGGETCNCILNDIAFFIHQNQFILHGY